MCRNTSRDGNVTASMYMLSETDSDYTSQAKEVTDINRQKFLAELAKLLTFMYEEDRQKALAMYNAMFDRVENEQALIQKLLSPTRQAVLIARAYDAKERKLQVHAQSREDGYDDESGDVPQFVLVIDRIAQDLPGGYTEAPRAVLEDQFSLFEEDSLTAEETREQEEAPAEEEENAPQEEEYSALDEVEGFIPIDIPDISVPDMYIPAPVQQEEAPAEEEPAEHSQPQDKVDAFMEELTLPEEAVDTPAPVEAPVQEAADQQMMAEFNQQSADGEAPVKAEAPATVRKARVALLILYILLAIPVGLVGMVLLLSATFLTLGAAVITVAAGIMLITAAFGGFTVFADILVVAGVAIIVLALGLLLLWLFVWLIGGAMVGLIRGLISLGGKWCYKEVAAA